MLVTWSAPPPEGNVTSLARYILTYFYPNGEAILFNVYDTKRLLDNLLSNTRYTVQVIAVGENNLQGPNAENNTITRK